MLSKSSKAYEMISKSRLPLIEGRVVCIDPSIGSSSSMPGYAVYIAGTLIASGTLTINPNGDLHEKAQELAFAVRRLYKEWEPDVLVYEEIAIQGTGRAIQSHVTLLKAVGIILSVSGPEHYVGIYPVSWKKMTRSTYVKSDENDAIEIGYVCIEEAKRIIEEDGAKQGRKFGQRKSAGAQARPKAVG